MTTENSDGCFLFENVVELTESDWFWIWWIRWKIYLYYVNPVSCMSFSSHFQSLNCFHRLSSSTTEIKESSNPFNIKLMRTQTYAFSCRTPLFQKRVQCVVNKLAFPTPSPCTHDCCLMKIMQKEQTNAYRCIEANTNFFPSNTQLTNKNTKAWKGDHTHS